MSESASSVTAVTAKLGISGLGTHDQALFGADERDARRHHHHPQPASAEVAEETVAASVVDENAPGPVAVQLSPAALGQGASTAHLVTGDDPDPHHRILNAKDLQRHHKPPHA